MTKKQKKSGDQKPLKKRGNTEKPSESENLKIKNMKMKCLLFTSFVAGLTLFSLNLQAQSNKCATMKILEQRIAKDPSILIRMQQSEIETQKWIAAHPRTKGTKQIITIPVVVHVIWHDPNENISDAQIQSQIDILNEDFRLLNSDSLTDTHPFWIYTADAEIEFCLASRDPSGNTTTGITRTFTDSTTFAEMDNPKYSAYGGEDNWDPIKYLNLWVCNLSGQGTTLGYAAFPADLATDPDLDGVVIRYEAFGDIGTAGTGGFTANNLGRTATHEVGHWLNLRHIWGDNQPNCGDDFVADTKPADEPNYGCPTFPLDANNPCGTDADGEMYMNYMDYVDDYCMNMFTFGQVTRMQSALNGDRAGLLTSSGCTPVGINEIFSENTIELYPNPNNGSFTVNVQNFKSENIDIEVYNMLGSRIEIFENINSFPFKMDLNGFSNGLYYLKINSGNKTINKKVIISK